MDKWLELWLDETMEEIEINNKEEKLWVLTIYWNLQLQVWLNTVHLLGLNPQEENLEFRRN